MKNKVELNIENRIWISANGEVFLDEDRVALLEAILKARSIRAAAESINMSYAKAWRLANEINTGSTKPLIAKKIGGTAGGGSTVSKRGKKAIKAFRKLQKRSSKLINKEFKKSGFFSKKTN